MWSLVEQGWFFRPLYDPTEIPTERVLSFYPEFMFMVASPEKVMP